MVNIIIACLFDKSMQPVGRFFCLLFKLSKNQVELFSLFRKAKQSFMIIGQKLHLNAGENLA